MNLSGDVRRADSTGDHNAIQDAGAAEDAYQEESLDGRRGQFAPCSLTLSHRQCHSASVTLRQRGVEP